MPYKAVSACGAVLSLHCSQAFLAMVHTLFQDPRGTTSKPFANDLISATRSNPRGGVQHKCVLATPVLCSSTPFANPTIYRDRPVSHSTFLYKINTDIETRQIAVSVGRCLSCLPCVASDTAEDSLHACSSMDMEPVPITANAAERDM